MNCALVPDVDRSLAPALFRQAMRGHAGAVTILTVGRTGARTGLTATSICSLSDAPPRIIACVNRNASGHDLIRREGAFGVNILHDRQQALAGAFAGRDSQKGEARFSAARWITLRTGAPILEQALVNLDCELFAEHPYDSHTIFVADVREVRIGEASRPLLYFGGSFSSLREGD